MKSRLTILICLILILQSCSRKMAVQGIGSERYDVLLQESHGGRVYVYLTRDTAYTEVYQIDKPSYFTRQDTMIRVKDSTIYVGQRNRLVVSEQRIELHAFGEKLHPKARRNYFLSVATQPQIQVYDSYKNQKRYAMIYSAIDKMIWPSTPRTASHEQLIKDDLALRNQIATLSQAEFQSALKEFKAKYSIN